MNQTTTPPPPPPGSSHDPGTGPDAERLRSITSTRRATDRRLVAGVATGIGRQLGIDPIIVRVVFVALCFAGLSGLILYAAAWFVLPTEDGRPSVMADWFRLGDNEPQMRIAGLTIAGALALVAIVGDTGWYWGGPSLGVLWLAVPALFLYWLFAVLPRQRASEPSVSAPAAGSPPPTFSSPAVPESPTAGDPATDDQVDEPSPSERRPADDGGAADEDGHTAVLSEVGGVEPPPAPGGGLAGPPAPPPHVPRTPPTLFLATMSVALIALGGLATVHAGLGLDLAPEIYPAVALGVVGAGLLVGARWGRSIALVPVGVVLSLVLGAIGLVPDGPYGDIRRAPVTSEAVDARYELGAGSLRIDLAGVRDPDELLGRTIAIDGGLGQIQIILPDDLAVTVEATISGGQIRVLGEETSGQGARLDVVSDERPALTLEIDHTFGQIDVERA